MKRFVRLLLLALTSVLVPACDQTTTNIYQQAAPGGSGGTGISLPPGALESGTILILSDRSTLLNMTTGENGRVLYEVALGGFISAGELFVAIDYRPLNNVLYGLTDQGRLYTINPQTGACAAVSATPIMAFVGTHFGMDFNPVVDRLRIVTDADENVRVNPDTGALVATDTPLSPSGNVYSIAYTNSFAGATTTTLFAIDQTTGSLYRLDNPNSGVMTLVGATAASSTLNGGFDISAGNIALVAQSGGGLPLLARIDLFTGTATGLFNIPTNFIVTGLAIIP